MRPMRWFATNRFVHLEAFLRGPLAHPAVPRQLRDRLEPRLQSAIHLARVRAMLFFIVYAAVISAAFTGLVGALEAAGVTNDFLLASFNVLVVLLSVLSSLVILALPALLLVARSLALLDADIQMLGAEAIARSLAADGPLPSSQPLFPESEPAQQVLSEDIAPTKSDAGAPTKTHAADRGDTWAGAGARAGKAPSSRSTGAGSADPRKKRPAKGRRRT